MKALILAGGRGTRLGALTADRPKPMLPIGGAPMLERIMGGIASQTPIRDFVLVTGYRADVIQDYFGDGSGWGWQIEYVAQPVPKGVGDAVHCARLALQDTVFLMTYGDIMLAPSNYGRFVSEYDAKRPPNPNSGEPETLVPLELGARGRSAMLVGLNWVEDPCQGAAVYLNAQSNIERIEEKPAPGTAQTHWNNAGLFVFPPLLFDYTARLTPSARGEYELPDAISAMIRDGHAARGLPLEGPWRDVGTPDDYAAINREFEQEHAK
ncbi:MAG: sugar phosphate nucleotidyltransferase [Armatimonadota bacterium]|nr:sugar phosphate nucleotidyltransferase [Armatimonadota bacterium]